jgi:RNA polymerase sigma factor (sigma-70 family)
VFSEVALDQAADPTGADGGLDAAEDAERHDGVLSALQGVMDGLDTEDRLIVRMHYQEGLTIADVARSLGTEQKPLYRRVERLRQRLRKALEDAGVDRARVREMLDGGEGK